MPFRPSGYVGWCATGATNVAEPTDAKKAVGWAVNEQPASSYFNWLLQKQDAYIQYLDWRSQLHTIVEDDFAASKQIALSPLYAPGRTGLQPLWDLEGPSGWAALDRPGVGSQTLLPMGLVLFDNDLTGGGPVASGIVTLKTDIGYLLNHDFRMEAVAKHVFISSGGSAEIGLFFNGTPSGALTFVATGASAQSWGLRYVPSGGVATSVNLGVPFTGFHKVAAERCGATMIIEIDGVTVATLPGRRFSSDSLEFGYAGFHPSTDSTVAAFRTELDRVFFGVSRNPT